MFANIFANINFVLRNIVYYLCELNTNDSGDVECDNDAKI